MEYRNLGKSDVKASVITFGAWAIGGWLWGGTDEKAAVKAIHATIDMGVTSIDTAAIYGQGLSENIVGEALKNTPRDQVQIFTKFGMRWDLAQGEFNMDSKDPGGKDIKIYLNGRKESIIYECEQSLKRLRTDYIDLYQQHWPDPTTPVDETMEALKILKDQGKIREGGVCNYKLDLFQKALRSFDLVSNQIPFSMVRRDFEKEEVSFCKNHGLAAIAYSPLQRGVLTGKFKPDYHFKEGDNRSDLKYFQPENIRRTNEFLKKIEPIAREHNVTLAQLVLRWTVNQPGITIALAGARNLEQAVQNAGATDFELSDEETKLINQSLEDLNLV